MALTTYANLLAEVRFRIYPDGDTTDDTRLQNRITWAVRDISSQCYCWSLQKTTSFTCSTSSSVLTLVGETTGTSSASTGVGPIYGLKNTTQNQVLYPLSLGQFNELDNTQTGTARYYIRYGNQILLNVIPDAADTLLLRYQAIPWGYSAVTNELPEFMEQAIVLGASYMILRDRNENERAQQALIEYRTELKRILHLQARDLEMVGLSTAYGEE